MPTHPEDLRRELAAAAAELGPLASDARGRVGRRARWLRLRRRVVSGVVAAALVSAGVALLASRGDDRVGVVTTPGTPKEVAPGELDDPDAIVYATGPSPSVDTVRAVLDGSEVVERYGVLEPCGNPVAGIELAEPQTESVGELQAALPADVSVMPLKLPADPTQPESDVDVFLSLAATPDQIASVEQELRDSPAVAELRFVSQDDALEEFRRIFADDPDLLGQVSAADLPVSFRVDLADGADRQAFAGRFLGLAAVEDVMLQTDGDATSLWFELPVAWRSVEVSANVDASPDEIATVGEALRESPRVTDLRFVSKEEAFEEFQRTFAYEPELLSAVTAADLPASWRVQVAEPYQENADAVRVLVAGMPGVDQVLDACSPFRLGGVAPFP